MGSIDHLAVRLAIRSSRRDAIKAASAGVLGTALAARAHRASAQDATPAVEEKIEYLFVQTATSGTFSPNAAAGTPVVDGELAVGGGAGYLLTLEGHSGHTIYFSDRPERIVGSSPTETFLNGLGFTPVNPPNAALVTFSEEGEQSIVVLELLTPAYDDAADTITYGATILNEYSDSGLSHLVDQGTSAELPESFGNASLFIDDCPDVTECVTMAMRGIMVPVGGVPGGPYGTCWSWSSFSCHPCNTSLTIDDMNRMCNETYEPDCGNNQCYAM